MNICISPMVPKKAGTSVRHIGTGQSMILCICFGSGLHPSHMSQYQSNSASGTQMIDFLADRVPPQDEAGKDELWKDLH